MRVPRTQNKNIRKEAAMSKLDDLHDKLLASGKKAKPHELHTKRKTLIEEYDSHDLFSVRNFIAAIRTGKYGTEGDQYTRDGARVFWRTDTRGITRLSVADGVTTRTRKISIATVAALNKFERN
jgi:hypothetical protein